MKAFLASLLALGAIVMAANAGLDQLKMSSQDVYSSQNGSVRH